MRLRCYIDLPDKKWAILQEAIGNDNEVIAYLAENISSAIKYAAEERIAPEVIIVTAQLRKEGKYDAV